MVEVITQKNIFQKTKDLFVSLGIKNTVGLAFVLLMGGGIIITYAMIGKQQDIRQQASETISGGILIPGYTTFIMLAKNQGELEMYQGLGKQNKDITYRTVNFNPTSEISLFESNKWGYFVTVASSDFATHQNSGSLYNTNITLLQEVAGKPGFRGFYFHEMMTYRALVNNWNWDIARDTLDWDFIKQIFSIAQTKNKKVIWSEPTYAWKTLYEDKNATIDPLFNSWATTLIPMYATNFTQPEIDSSKTYAIKVSQKYTLPLGESHQGGYWQDSSGSSTPTREESYNLALDGWNTNARYFQFEGNANDFLWDSLYMMGVRDFANFVDSK